MIDILKDDRCSSKIAFSHLLLPGYIDPQNVSTKKRPFAVFNAQHFSHTLDVLLPAELYTLIQSRLDSDPSLTTHYARVHMKLSDILVNPFFTHYIKSGNMMLRSEGRPNIDNIISLYAGTLRLELDRQTYERCGLQGHPVEDGGKKHAKQRWVVEFDLRSPSMLHGKKGFGRLEWAAKNVLDQSLTWLFYDFRQGAEKKKGEEGPDPLAAHHPKMVQLEPEALQLPGMQSPALCLNNLPKVYEESDESSLALLEWLHMLSLASPRLQASDSIDPFLSRYEVPGFPPSAYPAKTDTRDFVRLRWRGFIPPAFVQALFLLIREDGLRVEKDDWDREGGTKKRDEKRWFAISAKGFGEDEAWSVMQWVGRDTLCWEVL